MPISSAMTGQMLPVALYISVDTSGDNPPKIAPAPWYANEMLV